MVFFNYSTMQMAAKVVYYGPGLCGKTTNLQWIFEHTSNDSRGEMVSLATETDRTLFFDLLPIDVGSIAGFSTRIQLYTVPGQVFYNTTRKLVLKGVDGVVFVADSQKPMLQANIESFQNLEENLAEMGLGLDTIPLVLQFNKRDLPNIMSPEEMNAALNPDGNFQCVEASALNGDGVFETLKTISKATLLALKKRLTKGRSEPSGAKRGSSPAKAPPAKAAPAPPPRPAAPAPPPRPAAPPPPAAAPAPPEAPVTPVPAPVAALPETEEVTGPVATRSKAPEPEAPKPMSAPEPPAPPSVSFDPPEIELEPVPAPELDVEPVPVPEPAVEPVPAMAEVEVEIEPEPMPVAVAPEPEPAPAGPPAPEPPAPVAAPAPVPAPKPAAAPTPAAVAAPTKPKKSKTKITGLDALAELEKLRKQTLRSKGKGTDAKISVNGQNEIKKSLSVSLPAGDLSRARRFSFTLQLEDADHQLLDGARRFHVDVDAGQSLDDVLLSLKIALSAS